MGILLTISLVVMQTSFDHILGSNSKVPYQRLQFSVSMFIHISKLSWETASTFVFE